jgi:hypothetical protein
MQMKGYQRNFVDPYGATTSLLDGDKVFYHADLEREERIKFTSREE